MSSHHVEDKKAVVQSVSLGQRVAEEERDALATYFVETEYWRRVFNGDVDVVFAPKGGGKSAIYSMLLSRESAFFDRNILLAPGENPTGTPAFAAIEDDPPTGENQFVSVWKLYFLALSAQLFHDYGLNNAHADRLIEALRNAGVLTGDVAKRPLVTRVMAYVKRYFTPAASSNVFTLSRLRAAAGSLRPSTGASRGQGTVLEERRRANSFTCYRRPATDSFNDMKSARHRRPARCCSIARLLRTPCLRFQRYV